MDTPGLEFPNLKEAFYAKNANRKYLTVPLDYRQPEMMGITYQLWPKMLQLCVFSITYMCFVLIIQLMYYFCKLVLCFHLSVICSDYLLKYLLKGLCNNLFKWITEVLCAKMLDWTSFYIKHYIKFKYYCILIFGFCQCVLLMLVVVCASLTSTVNCSVCVCVCSVSARGVNPLWTFIRHISVPQQTRRME